MAEADTADSQAESTVESSPPTPPSPSKLGCPAAILTRLLSLAGHVALRQLVHLDMDVFGEIKRRQAVQEERDEKAKKTQSQQQQQLVTASGVKRNKVPTEQWGEGFLPVEMASQEFASALLWLQYSLQDFLSAVSEEKRTRSFPGRRDGSRRGHSRGCRGRIHR